MKFTEVKSLSRSHNLSTISAYYELTKPGITFLVLASMTIGFLLGSTGGIDYFNLLNAMIGTFLIASGTSAYNQYIERDLDKLMLRTQKRPLPMHRVGSKNAFLFSTLLLISGLTYLILTVNLVAGIISALTSILYLGFYTPLKRISFLNVFIGAIPGALPPVGGWAATTGHIDYVGMWILFGIVFLWQIPHVVAIAWLCNEDYERAGFHMLPLKDKNGTISIITIMSCLLLLIPVSVTLYTFHISGIIYLIGAIVSGLGFLLYGTFFMNDRSKDNAKKLMFASLFYLPLVWIFILIDKLI
jgi:protoheme IX farnesyltransferase